MSDNDQMTVTFGEGKRVSATSAGFAITTDQSVKNGGDASAPEPYSLFLASLATCAGYYVLRFAESRSLPTDGIDVTLTTERDEQNKRLARIRITVRLPPGFPDRYRDAVARVFGRGGALFALP